MATAEGRGKLQRERVKLHQKLIDSYLKSHKDSVTAQPREERSPVAIPCSSKDHFSVQNVS